MNLGKRFLRTRFFLQALFTAITLTLLGGCSVFGVNGVEEARFVVLVQEGDFELREYAPLVVVETQVGGGFEDAGDEAFRRLFGYISGANQGSREIAMTAPVIADPAENGWRFAFVLPDDYTLETAPLPTNDTVKLTEVESKRVAVVRYSGWWNDEDYAEQVALLQSWMQENDLEAASLPGYAGYDPPWTLPWFRRNEVLIDVQP